jgi:DNA replication and repair protein RecF
MQITRLKVDGLRCLSDVDLAPGPGLNLFLGPNGAGKTSLIESAYCLGSGKSFRFGGHDALIARDRAAFQIYAELDLRGQALRVGFERTSSSWRALCNGERVAEMSKLASLVPVVCFSPESHELVGGASDVRRRFFDWIVFHVEPGFADAHRRYMRALKQRNALLKRDPSESELATWTDVLVGAGEELAAFRDAVFPSFEAALAQALSELLGELGTAQIAFKRGWRDGVTLGDRLQAIGVREREVGYTLSGPHRADWSVGFLGHSVRDQGSRGQQKLVALAAVLVAARIYQQRLGHSPLIALDDLFSELDQDHQSRALRACAELEAQTWVTGTATSAALSAWPGEITQFHVEHGRVATSSRSRE